MQPNIAVSSPSTVYVQFTGEMPKLFCLFDSEGEVEYFRYMDGKTPRMKFNVPVTGDYTTNAPVKVVKIVPVEIPNLPILPPAERDRWKEPTFIYDATWTNTPASNFTKEGIIVHGPGWMRLIKPIRFFIDLHEVGHFLYMTEEKCDLFAFVSFMRMGYNKSTAYYALDKVLKRTPAAMERIRSIFNTIVKADGEFSPE